MNGCKHILFGLIFLSFYCASAQPRGSFPARSFESGHLTLYTPAFAQEEINVYESPYQIGRSSGVVSKKLKEGEEFQIELGQRYHSGAFRKVKTKQGSYGFIHSDAYERIDYPDNVSIMQPLASYSFRCENEDISLPEILTDGVQQACTLADKINLEYKLYSDNGNNYLALELSSQDLHLLTDKGVLALYLPENFEISHQGPVVNILDENDRMMDAIMLYEGYKDSLIDLISSVARVTSPVKTSFIEAFFKATGIGELTKSQKLELHNQNTGQFEAFKKNGLYNWNFIRWSSFMNIDGIKSPEASKLQVLIPYSGNPSLLKRLILQNQIFSIFWVSIINDDSYSGRVLLNDLILEGFHSDRFEITNNGEAASSLMDGFYMEELIGEDVLFVEDNSVFRVKLTELQILAISQLNLQNKIEFNAKFLKKLSKIDHATGGNTYPLGYTDTNYFGEINTLLYSQDVDTVDYPIKELQVNQSGEELRVYKKMKFVKQDIEVSDIVQVLETENDSNQSILVVDYLGEPKSAMIENEKVELIIQSYILGENPRFFYSFGIKTDQHGSKIVLVAEAGF